MRPEGRPSPIAVPKIRERIRSRDSSSASLSAAVETEAEAAPVTGGDADEASECEEEGNEEKRAPGDADDDGAIDVEATPPRAAPKDELAAKHDAATAIGEVHRLCLLPLHAPRPRRARTRP